MIRTIHIILLVTIIFIGFSNVVLNDYQNESNSTSVALLNNTNSTCESCNVIGTHIEVPCFSDKIFDFNNANLTCKIYYEVCEYVPCHTLVVNEFCDDCININFKGKTIRIEKKVYVATAVIMLIYLMIPIIPNERQKSKKNMIVSPVVDYSTDDDIRDHNTV